MPFPFKNPREIGPWNDSGTPKGEGYFGPLKNGKDISTELSFDFDMDGKKVLAPLLVPTLNQNEIDYLLHNNKPTNIHYRKAMDYAKQRLQEGKSPFAGPGEQWNVPQNMTENIVNKFRNQFPNWKKY